MGAVPIKLQCLKGLAAPEGLAADLEKLLALPEVARDRFWEIVGLFLRPDLDETGQATLARFCGEHDLRQADIVPPARAVRFLFAAAARVRIDPPAFAADLAALLPEGEAHALRALLLPWLEDFLPRLRAEIARQAIADHGKLVTGTSWRVDRVTSSDRGLGMSTSVAVVTLSYRDGERADRITLHMLPEQLDELRRAVNEMLA